MRIHNTVKKFPVKGAKVCATGLFPAWLSGFLSGIILSSLLIVWLLLRLYPPVSYSRQSPYALCIVVVPSVADPDSGSGACLIPGFGMGKKSISGIRDEHTRSYYRERRNI